MHAQMNKQLDTFHPCFQWENKSFLIATKIQTKMIYAHHKNISVEEMKSSSLKYWVDLTSSLLCVELQA
jgi:hypothetical protein